MSNLETLNQIKPKLKPEELETVDALRKELEQKVEKMNAVLKDLDNVINDASVSKETKLQAEEKFQQLESAKKVLSEKMSDPIIPIDETVTAPTIPEEPQAPKKTDTPEEVHNFIEHTGPNLERSRSDYVEVLFKNKDNFYPDVATLAYIKNLKESYHANINAEIEKIQPIGDRTEDKIASNKLRLKFLKDEHDAFQREILRRENEATKKRISKTVDTAIDNMGKGVNTLKEGFQNIPNAGEGMGWIYYLLQSTAIPIGIAAHYEDKIGKKVDDGFALLKNKFRQLTAPYDPNKAPLEEKKKKTLLEKFGKKGEKKEDNPEPKKPEELDEVEKKKQVIEKRTNEFLEKIFKGKVEGKNKKEWEKLKKIPLYKFFKPENLYGGSLDKLKPWQKELFDKMSIAYKKDNGTIKDTMKLEEYMAKLAEQDRLKELWNPS